MGCWSETIMGGDTPCDIECIIYDILGIEMYTKTDKERKIPKAKLEKEQNRIVKGILNLEDGYDSTTIGMQVFGVIMMKAGAKINENNKKLILNGAKNDDWAKSDKQRKKHIDNFISTVKSYTGRKPVDVETETLGEVFSKHSGGLINKNV